MTVFWCYTEGRTGDDECPGKGHAVEVLARDPTVETWAETLSTSALIRKAADEVERLRVELKRTHEAGLRLINENRQLREQLAQRYSTYHLTDKARAALAPEEIP